MTEPACAAVQATPRVDLPAEKIKALTERIQDAGTEVVKAKVCNGRPCPRPCSCIIFSIPMRTGESRGLDPFFGWIPACSNYHGSGRTPCSHLLGCPLLEACEQPGTNPCQGQACKRACMQM